MRILLALLAISLFAPRAHAVDLLIADPDANGVYVLDPLAGTREVISSGGVFRYPTAVAAGANGVVYVADPVVNAIFRVTLSSGAQLVVSSDELFRYPTGVVVLPDGDLLVADPDVNALFRIDPVTGQQSLEADLAAQAFLYPTDLAVDSDGDYRIADPDANGVFFMDPVAPSVAPLSMGGLLEYPTGIALDGPDLLVSDPDVNAIVRIEGETGPQSIEFEGLPLLYVTGVALAAAALSPIPAAPLAALMVLALLATAVLSASRASESGPFWAKRPLPSGPR